MLVPRHSISPKGEIHAACVRILRRDIGALGYPSSFTIYDEADAVRLTGYVLRDLNVDPSDSLTGGAGADSLSGGGGDTLRLRLVGTVAEHHGAQGQHRHRQPAHRSCADS